MEIHLQAERRQVSNMLSSPKRSALISWLLHVAAIALVLIATRAGPVPRPTLISHGEIFVPRDIGRYFAHPVDKPSGGGGGAREETPASRGRYAKVGLPFTPPMAVIRNNNPILPMEPAVLSAPPTPLANLNLPYGLPNGVDGKLSDGRGKNGGQGDEGEGGGGQGNGKGPRGGEGDPDGDGVRGRAHIVGTITAPILLYKVDPLYSDDARKAKIQGVVILNIDVDTHGLPQNIKLVQGLGLGLDERAVEAVRQWRFRAGTINGKPAVTSAVIHVTFRLL